MPAPFTPDDVGMRQVHLLSVCKTLLGNAITWSFSSLLLLYGCMSRKKITLCLFCAENTVCEIPRDSNVKKEPSFHINQCNAAIKSGTSYECVKFHHVRHLFAGNIEGVLA